MHCCVNIVCRPEGTARRCCSAPERSIAGVERPWPAGAARAPRRSSDADLARRAGAPDGGARHRPRTQRPRRPATPVRSPSTGASRRRGPSSPVAGRGRRCVGAGDCRGASGSTATRPCHRTARTFRAGGSNRWSTRGRVRFQMARRVRDRAGCTRVPVPRSNLGQQGP